MNYKMILLILPDHESVYRRVNESVAASRGKDRSTGWGRARCSVDMPFKYSPLTYASKFVTNSNNIIHYV